MGQYTTCINARIFHRAAHREHREQGQTSAPYAPYAAYGLPTVSGPRRKRGLYTMHQAPIQGVNRAIPIDPPWMHLGATSKP